MLSDVDQDSTNNFMYNYFSLKLILNQLYIMDKYGLLISNLLSTQCEKYDRI